MLSMDNKEIYFVHKVLLSRLKLTIGYPDHVNMTRNFSHFAIAKISPHPWIFFCRFIANKKVFLKTNHMTFHTLPQLT